jgi:hypothetical protein
MIDYCGTATAILINLGDWGDVVMSSVMLKFDERIFARTVKEVAVVHFKRESTVPEFVGRKRDKTRQLDCSPRNEARNSLV